MKRDEKQFLHGLAFAVAELVRTHDQPTMARDIIKGGGFELDHFKKARVDEYDLKEIEKALA